MNLVNLFRTLSISVILMFSHIYIWAEEHEVVLSASAEKIKPLPDTGKKRTMFFAPLITLHIDGNVFSWGSQFPFCGIELLTEDGDVVFSQLLSGMESSLTIPETLSGTLIIKMYLGDMVYTGEAAM